MLKAASEKIQGHTKRGRGRKPGRNARFDNQNQITESSLQI